MCPCTNHRKLCRYPVAEPLALKLKVCTLQRPLARMFQTAFLPVLWACIFSGQRNASHTWQEVYKWTLRVRASARCMLYTYS